MGTESGADLDENGNVVARCSSASAISLLEETEEALRKERQKLKELSFLWGDLCDKRILRYKEEGRDSVIRMGAILGFDMVKASE